MCKLFSEWEKDIQKYCRENGLDFSKAQKAGKCWGKDFLILQHVDEKKGQRGLMDESPAPVVLVVKRDNDRVVFEQTPNTRRYLAQ